MKESIANLRVLRARAKIAAGRRGGYGAGCRGVVTLWVEGSSAVRHCSTLLSLSGLSSLQGPGEYITEYIRAMGGRRHKSCSYLHYDEGINFIS